MPVAPSGGASLGDLYSKCVQMVNENKISAKNAWELPLIDHIDDIVESFMGGRKTKRSSTGAPVDPSASRRSVGGGAAAGDAPYGGQGGDGTGDENRFHEASCTIEASARIYACRVDCVHTDTYRVLGGLNSADLDAEDKDGEEGKGPASKKRRICGVNTLEKNEASIIQHTLESDEQSDPSFRRMAAAFDAGGARGLLLSHLPIAEDLSLVFNGDIPLSRAQGNAAPMFESAPSFPCRSLGLGAPAAAASKVAKGQACPGVDVFRKQYWGSSSLKVALPEKLDALLGAVPSGTDGILAMGGGVAPPPALPDGGMPPALENEDGRFDIPEPDMGFPDDGPDVEGEIGREQKAQGGGAVAFPLDDQDCAIVPRASDDVIAFDELFQKFCGAGGPHQFAYFDECWRKASAKEQKEEKAKKGEAKDEEGSLVPVERKEQKEKATKKPLFDLAGLDRPPKPIETEPVHKHQLSERAVQWQLHKDVPPYMIDRITMPSWPTWSKCDFACLGLRPHLMLKLMKKPAPEGDGPHRFTDLFSTVVVENPDSFPWLLPGAVAAGASRSDDDTARAEREMEMGDDGNDDDGFGGGLPSHLDVDPQDLFLRPEDKVLPDSDPEQDDAFGDGFGGADGMYDLGGGAGGDDDDGAGDFAPGVDFDLVEQPNTVGNTDINYSRNSKFVDVKLVKKHLWDVINEDIEEVKADDPKKTSTSSFQHIVDRTVRRLPKAETPNLSVQVCFICALHLCNEKGLELKVDPERLLGDFAVVGPK